MRKISVLLKREEYERFDSYCKKKGHKKSTLTATLIRDLLDREQVAAPRQLRDVRDRKEAG